MTSMSYSIAPEGR